MDFIAPIWRNMEVYKIAKENMFIMEGCTEKIITVLEAEQYGVSMEMVGTCREIRKLAKLDRIQLDESIHRNGLNKHLYSYIEYCGVNVKSYIKDYLANLQPYMLQRFSSQEHSTDFICVLDHMYRISLYIKTDKTFGKEIIVSFHESRTLKHLLSINAINI